MVTRTPVQNNQIIEQFRRVTPFSYELLGISDFMDALKNLHLATGWLNAMGWLQAQFVNN